MDSQSKPRRNVMNYRKFRGDQGRTIYIRVIECNIYSCNIYSCNRVANAVKTVLNTLLSVEL